MKSVANMGVSVSDLKAKGAAEGLRREAMSRLSRSATEAREARIGDAADPRLGAALDLARGGVELLEELLNTAAASK